MNVLAPIAPTQDRVFARLTLTDANSTATYFLMPNEIAQLRQQVEATDDLMKSVSSRGDQQAVLAVTSEAEEAK